jgi:hypothetical protein
MGANTLLCSKYIVKKQQKRGREKAPTPNDIPDESKDIVSSY